jgi:hypothetical protein
MCFRGGRFWGRENLVPAVVAEDFKRHDLSAGSERVLRPRGVCLLPPSRRILEN